MRYAVLSDLHANESALRTVLADARANGAERIVCLGDIVGYGPLPEETVRLARTACAVVLAGNHDDAVAGRMDPKDFIGLAADAVQRHREALSSASRDWLRTLGYTFAADGFAAVHGDFTDPRAFPYVDTCDDAAANFAATREQLLFVGHTHVPRLFLTGASGKVYDLEPTDFVLEDGKRYLVNPGSVGYPRENNGTCQSSYVLYDTETRTVRFRFLPFAVSSVLQRGTTPTRRRRVLIAATALAVSALAAATAVLLTPHAEPAVTARETDALTIQADRLPITPELRTFLPNLKLAGNSDPVLLKVAFRDGSGRILLSETVTVRKSRTKGFAIPTGTACGEIRLLKCATNGIPRIEAYRPAFKP